MTSASLHASPTARISAFVVFCLAGSFDFIFDRIPFQQGVVFVMRGESNLCLRCGRSVQDGLCAVGNARMRSTTPLRSFPSLAFQTVAVLV